MITLITSAFVMIWIYTLSFILWLFTLIPKTWNFIFKNPALTLLENKLAKTQDYNEWLTIAYQIDKLTGRLGWRNVNKSSYYDYDYVKNMHKHLLELIDKGDYEELASFMRSILSRNFSGIMDDRLYNYAYSGTKCLIDDYIEAVVKALDMLFQAEFPHKRSFFREIQHFYGRTCLLLSGGASFGLFHLGLLSNLLEQRLLPKIISGASAGSLICALVGTHTKEELIDLAKQNFKNLNFSAFDAKSARGSILRKVIRLVKYGYMIDKKPLMQFAIDNTFNLTFREAFERTGIVINISVTDSAHNKFRLMNYITAPNVYVWSAALASCSLPFVYAPTKLIAKTANNTQVEWLPGKKRFIDGSIAADIPKKALSVLFNATNFIVSQVNIHIVPFINAGVYRRLSRRKIFYKIWATGAGLILSEVRHRVEQARQMGLIPNKLALICNLLMQDYTGNVNIIPEFGLRDIVSFLDNPSASLIDNWCRRGRNLTFMCKLSRYKTDT